MSFSDFQCMDDFNPLASDGNDSDAEESESNLISNPNSSCNFNQSDSLKNENETEAFSSFKNDSYAKTSGSSWNFLGRVTGILSACSASSISNPSVQQVVDNNNNDNWCENTAAESSHISISTTQENPIIDGTKCSKVEFSHEETRDSESQFNWKNCKSSHIFNNEVKESSSSFSPYTPAQRSSSGIFKKLGALIGFNKLDTSHTFEPIEDEQIRHHRDIMNPTLSIRSDGYMLPLAHLATANCKKSTPENQTDPDISYCKDPDEDNDADTETKSTPPSKNNSSADEEDDNCEYCIKTDPDDEEKKTDTDKSQDKDESSAKNNANDEDEDEDEDSEEEKCVCPRRFEIHNCPIMRGFCPTPFDDPKEPFKDFQCRPEWNKRIGQTEEDCCECCVCTPEGGAAADAKASQESSGNEDKCEEESNAFLPPPSKTYPPMPKLVCIPPPPESETESKSGSGSGSGSDGDCKEEDEKKKEDDDGCASWAKICAKKNFTPIPFDNPQSPFDDFKCDESDKLNQEQEAPFCEDDLPICADGEDPYGGQSMEDDLPYCEDGVDSTYDDEDLPYCDDVDDGMEDLPYCDEEHEMEVSAEPSCDDKLKSYQEKIDELTQTLQCCEQTRNPTPSSTKQEAMNTSCEEKAMPVTKDPCLDENQNKIEAAKSAQAKTNTGCDSCLCKYFGICSTCNSEAAAAAAAAAKEKSSSSSSSGSGSKECNDTKVSSAVANSTSNSKLAESNSKSLTPVVPPPSPQTDCCATIPLRMDTPTANKTSTDCLSSSSSSPTLNKTSSDSDQKLKQYRQKIAEMQKKLRCCQQKEQETRQKNCEKQLHCYKQKLVEIQKVLRTIQENQRKAIQQLNNNNNLRANQVQDCRPIQVIIPQPRAAPPFPRGNGQGQIPCQMPSQMPPSGFIGPQFPPCPPYGQIPGQPWGNYPAYPPPQYRQPPPPPPNYYPGPGPNNNDFNNNNSCGPSKIPVPVPIPAAAPITPLAIPFSDCGSCEKVPQENAATSTDPCETDSKSSNKADSASSSESKVEAEDPEKIAAEDLRKCRERLTELKRKVFSCHGIDPNTILDENKVERLPNEKCCDSLQCCRAQVQMQEHKLRCCIHDNGNDKDKENNSNDEEKAQLAKEKAEKAEAERQKRAEEDKLTREKLGKYFRTSCKGYETTKTSNSNCSASSNPRPSRIPLPLSAFSSSCSPGNPPNNNNNNGYPPSSPYGPGAGGVYNDPASGYTFPDAFNYYGGAAHSNPNPQGYDPNYYDYSGQNYGNDYTNYGGAGFNPPSNNCDTGFGPASNSGSDSGRGRPSTNCDAFKEELAKLEREFEQLLEQERMKGGSGCCLDEKSNQGQSSPPEQKPTPPLASSTPPPPPTKKDDRCKPKSTTNTSKNSSSNAYDPPPSPCDLTKEKLAQKWEKFDQIPLTKVKISCEGNADDIYKAFNSSSEYFVKEDFDTAAKKKCPENLAKIPEERKKQLMATGKSQCDLSCFASPTRMDIHKMDQQLVKSMCKCPSCINNRYKMEDAAQGGSDEEDQEPVDPCCCPECGATLDENGRPIEEEDDDDEDGSGEEVDSCGRKKDKCKSDKFDLDKDGKPIYEGGMCLSRATHYMWKNCGSEQECAVRALGFATDWSGFEEEEEEQECKPYKGGQSMAEAQDFMWNKCDESSKTEK